MPNTNNTAIIPLSLYIHTPWCLNKCPYCDFNSYQLIGKLPEQEYVAALLADLAHDLPQAQGRSLTSIFIGGGTPSLFSAKSINQLLDRIHGLLPFTDNIEITLETNPATVEQLHLVNYKAAGITRISLGTQSFQNQKLQTLGRIHTNAEILTALEKITAANFKSFNIDLMYGLPNQTVDDAIFDLQAAIAWQPPHLSWYELTIEPGTQFYADSVVPSTEDLRLQIQEQGWQFLQQHGYQRYEISAYAQAAQQCQHNLNYWEFGDYLGIGAGAHSKITDLATYRIQRAAKKADPLAYLQSKDTFLAQQHILALAEIPVEFMLNALRLTNGFAKSLFTTRTNLSLLDITAILETAVDLQLLAITEKTIAPTAHGLMFLDEILQLFVT